MIPHVTQHDEADITELEAFRKSQSEAAKRDGVHLTLLAFVMKACVAALEQYPQFNASLAPDGQSLIVKKYFHIGVAVDTPEGLVVPVIRDADTKGALQIARELGEVSARARDRKLAPGDMQGGSFSISSLGGIGGTAFTPIINAPEVAILGVSRATRRPVYRDDGELQARLMLPLSLSYDHRVIDGAQGARFITLLSALLGDIRRLVL
jgi:pyruvate dehydrogenase E2 component (dihydrolipoamide acetyltransferase)